MRTTKLVALLVVIFCSSGAYVHGFAPIDSVVAHRDIEGVRIELGADSLWRMQQGNSRQVFVCSQLQLPAVFSVQELLEHLPGLDVRQRGPAGTQADLSIRGGGFDQAMILVNGVDLTDAQTGHHNLNLPIRAEAIAYVELITGPDALRYGPGAFAGAVNIVTKRPVNLTATGELKVGQYGLLDGYLDAGLRRARYGVFSSVGVRSLKGYAPNTDHTMLDAYLDAYVLLGPGELRLQGGHQAKGFGANAFYSPKFPEQYEALQTSFATLTYQAQWGGWKLKGGFNYRSLYDRFELFRWKWADWYAGHNYHHSQLYAGQVGVSYSSSHQSSRLELSVRHDEILSNNLGEPLSVKRPVGTQDGVYYDKFGERTNYSATLSNQLQWGHFTSKLAAMGTFNTAFGWEYGAGAEASYLLPANVLLAVGATRSYRLPTFTDLYYHSKTQLGDKHLRPEAAWTFTFQASRKVLPLYLSATMYYRLGRDLIDWQQVPDNPTLSVAKNHAKLNALGAELSGSWLPGYVGLASVNLYYAYCHLLRPQGEVERQSYLLNNLEHQATLATLHPLPLGFSISLAAHLNKRRGDYIDMANDNKPTPYPWTSTLDAKVSYQWHGLTLSVEARNMLDTKVVDYANIPQPGIWILGSVRYTLGE